MVKVEDGQLILGGQALSGGAEDDEGKPIKFEPVEGAIVPAYQAKVDMKDGSGRAKFYSFSLNDTNVRISVITKTPEQLKVEEQGSKKSAAAPAAAKEEEQQGPSTNTKLAYEEVSLPPEDLTATEEEDNKEEEDKDMKKASGATKPRKPKKK